MASHVSGMMYANVATGIRNRKNILPYEPPAHTHRHPHMEPMYTYIFYINSSVAKSRMKIKKNKHTHTHIMCVGNQHIIK